VAEKFLKGSRGMALVSFKSEFFLRLLSRLAIIVGFGLVVGVLTPALLAAVGGTISGTVTDPKGLLVSGAKVTATQLNTNIKRITVTDAKGFYSLTALPVGFYEVRIDAPGYKQYRETNLNLNASSALLVDASLLIGERTETITVSSSNVRVESVDTQLGEVIESFEATAVPLNGRSFTDLLALQPGIAPATSFTASSLTAAGASTISPSGNLNPGTISINGQREFSNGFSVNGSSVEEPFTMGAGVIPNLDSIAEFRILTSNVDAEYGNYSGGLISVVTKSGANRFHGGLFEFVPIRASMHVTSFLQSGRPLRKISTAALLAARSGKIRSFSLQTTKARR
jgi:Carboxypeptidase regulatory-like domain